VKQSCAGVLRLLAIMAATSNMFLYSLTVQPSTNVTFAVLGQFAGTKEQHIATACGSRLTLLRPDPSLGKVITLLSHDVFGIIRSIAAFRLAGSNKGMSYSPNPSSLKLHLVISKLARRGVSFLEGVRLGHFYCFGAFMRFLC
jgi:hypothetical protein